MNYLKAKVADLRKLAEEKEIEGYEEMNRKELIEALKDGEDLVEAPEEVTEAPEVEEAPEVPETSDEAPQKSFLDSPNVTEYRKPAVGSKAEAMKLNLLSQRLITILIPQGSKEPAGMKQSVTLNAYRVDIAKGTYVEVPEQIAKIIMTSQNQTAMAINNDLNLANPNHLKRRTGEGTQALE